MVLDDRETMVVMGCNAVSVVGSIWTWIQLSVIPSTFSPTEPVKLLFQWVSRFDFECERTYVLIRQPSSLKSRKKLTFSVCFFSLS